MADPEVPEEIQDYYQTERRERAGVAWLLAFGTLVVTILLAGGIFFGGRAIYRNFAGTDDGGETPQEVAQNNEEQERPNETNNQSQEEQPSNQPNQSGGRGEDNSVQGDSNNTNDDSTPPQPSTPTPPPTPAPTPATGDSSGDLPGTGPGSTLTIFFAVSLFGYFVHRFYTKTNQ